MDINCIDPSNLEFDEISWILALEWRGRVTTILMEIIVEKGKDEEFI